MTAHLITTSSPTDHARALRAAAAWFHGDKLGLDVVMQEVGTDPRPDAAAGLILAALAQWTATVDLSDDPERLIELYCEKVAALTREAG